MNASMLVFTVAAIWLFAASAPPAQSASAPAMAPQQLAKIVPGQSHKADVRALLGAPWRVVQFNDCGMAMDDQADETWEYRGADGTGGYRVHIEFGDDGAVHLIAKIPDAVAGGAAVSAKVAPASSTPGMSM